MSQVLHGSARTPGKPWLGRLVSRSSLHRLFQRRGISRLADVRDKPSRSTFKTYAVGYVHIDIAELWTEEGKLTPFLTDRTPP